jgi:hypothetical protein
MAVAPIRDVVHLVVSVFTGLDDGLAVVRQS